MMEYKKIKKVKEKRHEKIWAKCVLLLVLIISCTLFFACGDENSIDANNLVADNSGAYSLYQTYVAYATANGETPLAYESWLNTLKGPKGDQGLQGLPGKGITNFEKVSTVGLVDTYVVTYSDGTTYSFSITNGTQGSKGDKGADGRTTELRVDKTSGYVQWRYTDSNVWNNLIAISELKAEDGLTPYIGENGNWWIGETDTEVTASYKSDTRELTVDSNGLVYEAMTWANKSGFIVTGWTDDYLESWLVSSEEIERIKTEGLNIVIPNYIGLVPVIGIKDSAFKGNTSLKSISLSSNTSYLGTYCFYGCTKLETVDFNGCSLTSIPTYCFQNTAIKNIELPETVTKLDKCAFYNTPLESINYENITYYGEGCLNDVNTNYFYLKNNVEYVGKEAFSGVYVYTEHATIPTTWNASPVSEGKIVPQVKNNGEYLYSLTGGNVTLYKYLGDKTRLTIPSKLDSKTVTTIGYGFASESEMQCCYVDENKELSKLKHFDELIVPNTVTTIEEYALMSYDTMIFIPSSVTKMGSLVGWCGIEDDYGNSYVAFEGSSAPITISSYLRHSFDIDYSKVEYNETEHTFYYNNGSTYSILAVMAGCGENVELKGTYNSKIVTTVMPYAVAMLPEVKSVKLTGNFVRVKPYAICNLSYCNGVFVNKNIELINANAIICSKIFVEATSKPSDWDTLWCGSSSSTKVYYGVDMNLEISGYFGYKVSNDKVILYKYFGDSSSISIPRTIDNKVVTTIKQGFYSYSSNFEVYIPNNITTIESMAFVSSRSNYSYYSYFYFENASKTSGIDTNYYYNSYFSSTEYKYEYFSQSFGY